MILSLGIAHVVTNSISEAIMHLDTLELGGPKNGRFLVRRHRDDAPEDCLLTESEFVALLYLCRAFLLVETKIVDLLKLVGFGSERNVWTIVRRLRISLHDTQKQLVINEMKTLYSLDAIDVDYGPTFPLCRTCIDTSFHDAALIDDLISAIDRRRKDSA